MNRRSFLAAIAAALVLDPERALWVPRKKLISIASVKGTPAGPFLEVGDILTFEGFPGRFIVTRGCYSVAQISDVRMERSCPNLEPPWARRHWLPQNFEVTARHLPAWPA